MRKCGQREQKKKEKKNLFYAIPRCASFTVVNRNVIGTTEIGGRNFVLALLFISTNNKE